MARTIATTSELLARAVGSFQAGELDLACAMCFSILQAQPAHLDALLLVAAIWLRQGQAGAARRMLDQALLTAPGHPEANKMLRAMVATPEGGTLSPTDSAQANLEAGMKHWEEHHYHAALACWQRAVALDPARSDLLNYRARAFAALGIDDAAEADFARALALKPDFAEAHNNLGALLHRLGRREAAAASYRHAITIRPDYALAHSNLGNALCELKRFDEALTSYDRAIDLKPDYAEAQYNRGNALCNLKRFDEALASYDLAIDLKPDYAEVHWNKALLHLLVGDFQNGWQKYEWRWRRSGRMNQPRAYPQPLWLGDTDVCGKRILLSSEQGFGDSLQFCRYVTQVAALGAVVILEAPAALAPLLKPLAGVTEFVAQGEALPSFDFHCPLLSLPLAFGTTLDSLSGKPYLVAPPKRITDWTRALGKASQPRVGLAWSGNANVSNDHNRAIPLSRFSQGLPSGIEYIQLQKDVRAADQAWLDQHPEIRSFDSRITDFGDTAALIASLDLVITIDTSITHLAGALGKEVWILLPHVPDWRWLLDRSDSPWYDAATLFRQPTPGDWDSVLAAARQALAEKYRLQRSSAGGKQGHPQ